MRRISSLMKAALTPSERRAGFADDGPVERQAPAKEPNQLAAADRVGQRDLDRLVDAAGATGQRRLKLARAGWW
jgi:hypothetical protein